MGTVGRQVGRSELELLDVLHDELDYLAADSGETSSQTLDRLVRVGLEADAERKQRQELVRRAGQYRAGRPRDTAQLNGAL